MIIEEFLKFVITTLFSSGAGILVAAYLSKKFVTHQLDKNIEEFKSRLLVEQSLGVERKKYAFQEEVDILRKLWKLVVDLSKTCGSYDNTKISELQKQHDNLEKYLNDNKPFISEQIENKCKDILQLSDPENYKGSGFDEIKSEIDSFVRIYRSRLLLE